jgi:hypothetical protein
MIFLKQLKFMFHYMMEKTWRKNKLRTHYIYDKHYRKHANFLLSSIGNLQKLAIFHWLGGADKKIKQKSYFPSASVAHRKKPLSSVSQGGSQKIRGLIFHQTPWLTEDKRPSKYRTS